MDTIDEAKVREVVAKAKSTGWELSPDFTINRHDRQCCPLGAALIDSPRNDDLGLLAAAAAAFGVSVSTARAFALGFDGDCGEDGIADRDAFDLGRKFRLELLGK